MDEQIPEQQTSPEEELVQLFMEAAREKKLLQVIEHVNEKLGLPVPPLLVSTDIIAPNLWATREPDTVRIFHEYIAATDQLILWTANVAHSLHQLPDEKLNMPTVRAFDLIFTAVLSHLIAVRELSLRGLDVQAKQILRCLIEYIELAMLISAQKHIAVAFLGCQDFEQMNEFWHTHFGKAKARKFKASRQLAETISESAAEGFRKWHSYVSKVLSAAVHPSIAAATLSGSVSKALPEMYPAFFPPVRENCVETLQYLYFSFVDIVTWDNQSVIKNLLEQFDLGVPEERASHDLINNHANALSLIGSFLLARADYLRQTQEYE